MKRMALPELLAPGFGVVQAPKGKERRLPKPEAPAPSLALTVYRCQLVAERTIAVPRLTVVRPSDCKAVLWQYFAEPDREIFVVLMLDRSNTLLGINTVAIGSTEEVFVSVREIFKPALLRNADRIIIAHNHLNGDTRPSKADKRLTRLVAEAGRALEIQLCDHIILGRTSRQAFSFLDAGLLKDEP